MTDAELKAAIAEVRDRARANAPQGETLVEGVSAADLMPLLHARDAAQAKVAAIGTVNPRPPGLKNSVAQGFKKFISRALNWHVREQVEFNRATMECVEAALEALTEVNRGISRLAAHHEANASRINSLEENRDSVGAEIDTLQSDLGEFNTWRAEFEERYLNEQIRILRTVSELQAAYQHRLSMQEEGFRQSIALQHHEFNDALKAGMVDVQKKLWEDMARIRAEYERLIHTELRLLRQKQLHTATAPAPDQVATTVTAVPVHENIDIDWMRFAEQFRGSEERIRAQQGRYIERFKTAQVGGPILDVGCGRGEFLEAAREAGLDAYGVELNEECVALCNQKGLSAEVADMFTHLESLVNQSLGGFYCSQVVEHLRPAELVRLVRLAGAKLKPGALAAFETPNPACLAIFATHFYIDPTHTRPVPPVLLRFYLEESGFANVEVEYMEPAAESMPAIKDLPESVQQAFFGGLDYSLFAKKL